MHFSCHTKAYRPVVEIRVVVLGGGVRPPLSSVQISKTFLKTDEDIVLGWNMQC